MCGPKIMGGLGLRDLACFNRALLAKQGWRLLTAPNSLMTRVLKGKYFPKCVFLDAKLSQAASYTWRSIVAARDVLKTGVRWTVGRGDNINIWSNPWIPSIPSLKVWSEPNLVGCPLKLSELIDHEECKWKQDVLHHCFNNMENMAIKRIPIAEGRNEDIISWHYTKNGVFTVKSAYHLCKLEDFDRGSSSYAIRKSVWKSIWQLNLPQKIKNFAWRVMHNGLAV